MRRLGGVERGLVSGAGHEVRRPADRAQRRFELRGGDDRARRRQGQAVGDFRLGPAPIEADDDGADLRRRQLDLQEGDAVAGEHGDPVAAPGAQAAQDAGQPVDPGVERAVGQAARALDQGGPVAVQPRGRREQPADGRRAGLRDLRRRNVDGPAPGHPRPGPYRASTRASARTGLPEPWRILSGAAITTAPWGGSRSRLVSAGRPKRPAPCIM